VLALCQIRFTQVLGVAEEKVVAPFQRAIQVDYPILRPAPEVDLEVVFGPEVAVQRRTRAPQWRFSDREQNWTVVLAQDFLALETRRYDRFEDFLDRLRRLLGALVEHVQPALLTRIGLRYIDEIREENPNWPTIISPALLGPLAVPALAEHAAQSVQELRLVFPGDEAVNLRHGLFPNGTTVEPRPGEKLPSSPFYLLDCDAYRAFSPPDSPAVEPEAICALVAAYHRVLHRLFRWSITEKFTERLGVRQYAD
jgi:uncharacterized protein (TIGR04255 family)